jgi:hypothetical protein
MHRLNMELDLQILFGLHVHSWTHWLIPLQLPPLPAFGLIYEGAIGRKAKIDDISLWPPWLETKSIEINWFENILTWA